jgi:hypothetical protein
MARIQAQKIPTNPLAPDADRDHRIRERAYHLWESEGRPHGRDLEYWERARELIGMEESAGSGLLPNPSTTPKSPRVSPKSPRETGSEQAAPQENPGKSPERPADRGEVKTTPAPKRRSRAKPKKPA